MAYQVRIEANLL